MTRFGGWRRRYAGAMLTLCTACLLAVIGVVPAAGEPPERGAQNRVEFPPAELVHRWFGLESAAEGRSLGRDADEDAAIEAGLSLDDGLEAMRANVLAQYRHDRDITSALDDLDTYLRCVGADDPTGVFETRTALGLGFHRDSAEHMLVPSAGVYASVGGMGSGDAPPRRATPPPAPPTPRDIDPTLEALTDREVHERLWRHPPRSGHTVVAVDADNVFVSDEWWFVQSPDYPEWPISSSSGMGTVFSSPGTLTMEQRITPPEDPRDILAIRVFVQTATGHTGLVRFVYRYDHWLADWVPAKVSTSVYSPDWSLWLPGY